MRGLYRLFSYFLLFSASWGFSGEASEFAIKRAKVRTPTAIRLALSQKGQQELQKHFPQILKNFGFSFERIRVPEMSYKVPSDHELLNNPKLQDFVGKLHPWLPSLVPLQRDYSIRVEDIEFLSDPISAKFEAVSSRNNGVEFAFEFNLASAQLDLASAAIFDESPEELKPLGEVSVKELSLSSEGELPVSISGLMHFDLDENSKPSLSLTKLNNNISQTQWSLDVLEFLVPELKLLINGYEHKVSQSHINDTFQAQLDDWIDKIRDSLSEALSSQILSTANEKLSGVLPEKLGFQSAFPAPGKPLTVSHPDLKLSAEVVDFSFDHYLQVGVKTSIADPMFPTIEKAKVVGSTRTPQWSELDVNSSDLILSLDSALINKVILSSFKRGYFKALKISENTLTLRSLPQVRPIQGKVREDGRFVVRAAVDYPRTGLAQPIVLNDPIQIEIDIICRFAPSKDGKGIDVLLDQVDTSRSGLEHSASMASYRILDSSFKWTSIFPGVKQVIYSKLKSALDKLSHGWKTKDTAIVTDLKLVPSLMGMELLVKDMVFHSSGNVLFYMDIGDVE